VTFFIFGVHMMGISSIMGAINVIATVLNLRAPGMTLMKMPLFAWTWLITAFLLIAVMPVLAGCVTMMLMDIHFGTSFFNAAGGGDPVLFQQRLPFCPLSSGRIICLWSAFLWLANCFLCTRPC